MADPAFPWLSVAAAVPAVGALAVAAVPRGREELAKRAALAVSLVTLALVLVVALQFDRDSGQHFQFTELHEWIPALGASYSLGVDGIALVLLGLTAVLSPVCLLASWNDVPSEGRSRPQAFFALMLLVESLLVLVFSATDVFLFYVAFEFSLIPMYFIIGGFGGPRRSYAAVKFLIYSLLGGLLMLAAVIGTYVAGPGGERGFLRTTLEASSIDPTTQRWLFLGFMAAFAVKAPLWPFHTWLPDAAAEAPPGGAVMLVGVLDKIGTYGMIAYCLPLFPDASVWARPVVIALAVVGIVYGALVAIGQADIIRLVAYTSISHFGFIALGIFAMTTQSQSGSTLYMLSHGFSTAGLFLIAGMLVQRRGSRRIADFGGVQTVAPLLAGSFLLAGLSSLALPGFSSFVSEFLVLAGTFERYKVVACIAVTAIVLAALYILILWQRTMTGPVAEGVGGVREMVAREAWVVAPVIALLIGLGVAPQVVLDVVNPAVGRTLQSVDQHDPAPVAGQAATAERTTK
ncbi:NADH-quinone oxidoreductase subunit M [Motilibacter peucedani]|uniref:NADH-quinone oxidoreductase subunit M n=1 Tax=Motilibacter peucedani TaxID=598650 RepID=A0A420XLI5_9ACTN|nr:NADH-quinone oxidoreductase subunit M [Motilibacter peucedani]RKS69217.1 NADH-quinone oxidoreductase subunit M [Motilibacter peucedani]